MLETFPGSAGRVVRPNFTKETRKVSYELDAETYAILADFHGYAPEEVEFEWCESGYCHEHEEEYNAYMILEPGNPESRGMAYVGKSSGEVW